MPAPTRTPPRVLWISLARMTADGQDVVSYGAVLPTMLADSGWGLTVPEAGLLGSLTPVGMLVGAIVLCAIAPGVTLFGIGLVLVLVLVGVGVGVGGGVPSMTALVFEYSAPQRRNVNTAVAFAGIGIGGAASAVVAATVVPAFGFRSEFLVGGLAALVILPLAAAFLPESLAHLRAAGREADARPVGRAARHRL